MTKTKEMIEALLMSGMILDGPYSTPKKGYERRVRQPLYCECGGLYKQKTEGLKCKECHHVYGEVKEKEDKQ